MKILALTAALLLAAGAAHAEGASDLNQAVYKAKASVPAHAIVWDQADAAAIKVSTYARDHQPTDASIPKGTVKTAIDRRFDANGSSAAIGYLCGLAPGPNETGGVASSYEPSGTFLGAQLKIALK